MNDSFPSNNVVGRCASCKHWDTAADQYHVKNWIEDNLRQAREGQDDPWPSREEVDEAMKPWGECLAVVQKESAPEGAIAVLSDGSGYFAGLSTLASFGCVLWEG